MEKMEWTVAKNSDGTKRRVLLRVVEASDSDGENYVLEEVESEEYFSDKDIDAYEEQDQEEQERKEITPDEAISWWCSGYCPRDTTRWQKTDTEGDSEGSGSGSEEIHSRRPDVETTGDEQIARTPTNCATSE